MKKILLLTLATIAFMFTGCQRDADIASRNLSQAADMFEIDRRIVFYNGITGEYLLELQGKCSLGNYDSHRQLSVTCKTGYNEYKKHFLGLSDNVTYFAEQITSKGVSVYHSRVIFKPQAIIPDIDFRGSSSALVDAIVPDNKD